MKKQNADLFVKKEDTILSVLKKMDQTRRKLLIVIDGSKFVSMVSIGDIQRAIIKGCDIKQTIENILRPDISYATTQDDVHVVKEKMLIRRNEMMPIITNDGEIADIIFWEDIFEKECKRIKCENINLPVVIMAGGEGSRLKPITNVLPKPLMPLKEKTIIEEIIDNFKNSGCNEFYISINYKAEFIRYYINSLNYTDAYIDYFQETKPLGTVGSLFLIKDKIKSTLFISNCDIIIEEDYGEILKYHRENKNEMTIVAALMHHKIPYGTLITGEDGLLKKMEEKPEVLNKINTGFYIIEPEILKIIPDNKYYDITSLIDDLLRTERKVGVFPVKETSWIDIGNWAEYNKYIS